MSNLSIAGSQLSFYELDGTDVVGVGAADNWKDFDCSGFAPGAKAVLLKPAATGNNWGARQNGTALNRYPGNISMDCPLVTNLDTSGICEVKVSPVGPINIMCLGYWK